MSPIRISKRFLSSLGVCLLLGAVVSLPAAAQPQGRYYAERDNTLRFRLGQWSPEGDGDYWNDKFRDFSGSIDDFEEVSFGVDYLRDLSPRLALIFSGSSSEAETDQFDLDFVDDRGFAIEHTTTLEVDTLTAGLLLRLTNPRAPVVPYLGAGGGLYSYTLRERGDFVDVFTRPPSIFRADLESSGDVLGYYWLAGLEVRLTPSWKFFAEGRWHNADDELGEDFDDFGTLDLSSREILGGVSFSF